MWPESTDQRSMAAADRTHAPTDLEPLQEVLQALGIDADADYASAFQHFAECSCELEASTPTADLLLERSQAAFQVGDFHTALLDALQAEAHDDASPEPHLLQGRALLALAAVRTGLLAPGPGMAMQVVPPLDDLLCEARDAIGHTRRLLPDDPEVERVHERLARMQGVAPS